MQSPHTRHAIEPEYLMLTFTQAEKESYLMSLSEDDFREKVVRRLFKRLGFADGRDLCGPEERGKDAIFFEDDKFGVRSVVAVQTKKGSITLAGDPSKNLHEVRAQLRTALESPFVCMVTKVRYVPTRVYLVASGRINEAARDHITTNINNDPRIHYLDRDDIIARVDAMCQEVWLNITADVFPYLHSLAKLVEDQALLGPSSTSVAGIKSYYSASDRAFVDLKLVRSKSILKKQSGKFIESFEFEETGISALLSLKGERLLLLGDAGSGKSTLLIRAAYTMARDGATRKQNYRVPVILRANDVVTANRPTLVADMEESVSSLMGPTGCAFSSDDLEAGRVVVLMDGLDEVAIGQQRAEVVSKLNEFFGLHPRCSIVLTTRPYSSIEAIEGVRGFTRCRISSMSLAKAEKMLISYQKGTLDQEHANEILRRINGIHGIELNPLLVTVFALTSEQDRRDIPANITELFSKFTELMLGRWDENKGVSQQYQAKVKEHLISQFANQLHLERRTQFTRAEFEAFSEAQLREMNRSSDASSMISEIVDRSGLLREVGLDLEFRHHLMQEYFAGKGIAGIDAIKSLVADEWWRNAIVFYFGSNPRDVQGLLDVATSVGTNAKDACLTVGLALQTCYLSRLEDKIDVWKWVVTALAAATEQVLSESSEQRFPIFHFLSHYIISRDAVALSGVEIAEMGAVDWASGKEGLLSDSELTKFWAYVALCEIGRLDLLAERIQSDPIQSAKLCFALSAGCRLVEVIRSVQGTQKEAAIEIRKRLTARVSVLAYQFAKEYRGQLLEYRKGGIVALDQIEGDDEGKAPRVG